MRQPCSSQRIERPRAPKLLVSVWSLLQASEHRKLDQKTIAYYGGLTETTLSNWILAETELTQIEALLRLIERLPEQARTTLLSSCLRPFPNLGSASISHDPIAVETLRMLVTKGQGFTFVLGARDFLRSYVLAAIAHSATHVGSALRPIEGVDAHNEGALVPVPGVIYCATPSMAADLFKGSIGVGRYSTPLLVNGLWPTSAAIQSLLVSIAKTRHVLVADDIAPQSSELAGKFENIPVRIVTVSELSENRIGIAYSERTRRGFQK